MRSGSFGSVFVVESLRVDEGAGLARLRVNRGRLNKVLLRGALCFVGVPPKRLCGV